MSKLKKILRNNVIYLFLYKTLNIIKSMFNLLSKHIKINTQYVLLLISKNFFLSYAHRPKASKFYNNEIPKKINKGLLGIIIQGPSIGNEKFIIETIKIYKKNFKGSHIVLSTWDDSDKTFINQVKKLKVKLILNNYKKDMFQGFDHQIETTHAALKFLKNKVKFSLKTRTDCRIYGLDVFNYLKSLLELFPLKSKNKYQKQRIIASSLITPKFRVYGLTDIMMFGTTSDLINYFKKEFFHDSCEKNQFKKFPSLYKGTLLTGEIMLCARYLKYNGETLKWTLKHWCDVLKKYFIVVSHTEIDLFWKKYSYENDKRFISNYQFKTKRVITFSDWLSIYKNNYDVILKYNYKEKWKLTSKNFKYNGTNFD